MQTYVLIDSATNNLVGGPFDEPPIPADSQRVEKALLGFPETCRWSATANGFVDIEMPPEPYTPPAPTKMMVLLDNLVRAGVLTNADASSILAHDDTQA